MMNFQYYIAKILKKLSGKAIKNSSIHKTSKIEAGSIVINSSFEKYSFCGYNCKIINCKIGAFTSIADGVIVGGAMHPMNWAGMSPVFYDGRDSIKKKFITFRREVDKTTIIGNDVWIGDRALIKAGVTIGDGAVIGMGSVVTKDVAPYTIMGGNPAKVIRKRFNDEVIKDFLNIKWWEVDEGVIVEAAKYVKEPQTFLRRIEKE